MLHSTAKNPNVKVVKDGDVYRIRRHDGELVGAYMKKELAQKHIDTLPYLHHSDVQEHDASYWNKK